MRNFLKQHWILIAVIILAAFLRLWKLGSIPPSLTQDEAALGYNAYSILKTGRDEYGKVMPFIFKSFGDYKPGLYVYLDVPFVAVLGLNEIAVRLPSALAGILSVYLIYLIIKKLFSNKKYLPLFSALIFAITPWNIYLSRGAWEVNVALTLTLGGVYFFLKSLDNAKSLLLSVLLFALTLLDYQGAKLSTAVVVLLLLVSYWKQFRAIEKKYIAGSFILGLIIVLPVILSLFTGQAGRLDVFSIFSYPRPRDYTQAFLDEGGEKYGDLNYYLYHSESLNFARGIMGRWFNHFSGKFLFFEGDYQNPQHSAPYQGLLLITDFAILVLGFVCIFKAKNIDRRSLIFVFAWLFLSPLPAVLSRDQVQAVRAFNMVVPLTIILSLGADYIFEFIRSSRSKTLFYIFFIGYYLAGFVYFCDAYFIHVPVHNSSYWNYGFKDVVNKVTNVQSDYKSIIVEQSFAQPYIYFLFYQKYNPSKYQAHAVLNQSANASDVGLVPQLDNIYFRQIDWSAIRQNHGTLVVVGFQNPIPPDLQYDLIEKIMYLNGRDLAFTIIRIK